jgi:hypothetical protein
VTGKKKKVLASPPITDTFAAREHTREQEGKLKG